MLLIAGILLFMSSLGVADSYRKAEIKERLKEFKEKRDNLKDKIRFTGKRDQELRNEGSKRRKNAQKRGKKLNKLIDAERKRVNRKKGFIRQLRKGNQLQLLKNQLMDHKHYLDTDIRQIRDNRDRRQRYVIRRNKKRNKIRKLNGRLIRLRRKYKESNKIT